MSSTASAIAAFCERWSMCAVQKDAVENSERRRHLAESRDLAGASNHLVA